MIPYEVRANFTFNRVMQIGRSDKDTDDTRHDNTGDDKDDQSTR